MKSNLTYRYSILLAISVVAVGFLVGSASARMIPGAVNDNPRIIPPNAKAYGMTYGEWNAKWWQWAFSLAVDENPFFDENGSCANGANGQSEKVWFLTGVINASGTVVRDCTVPKGKALFFPILNAEDSTLESGLTGADLYEFSAYAMSIATNLEAEIDGVPVENLEEYRATSPLFAIGPLPENNVLQFFGYDAPELSTSAAAADGYYLMLAPLPVGEHSIHFTGTFGDPLNYTLDITYNITVE